MNTQYSSRYIKVLRCAALVAVGILSASAASAFTYSAIAVSPNTSSWGRGYDWPTMDQAKDTAMSYCRQYSTQPDDCRVVAWSQGDYCAAVVYDPQQGGGMIWGSASGPTIEKARDEAFLACEKYAGHPCPKILVDVCSHGN